MAKSDYKALVGLSYGEKNVEAGQIVSDIPKESIAWLLASGFITADVSDSTPEIVVVETTQTPIDEETTEPTPSETLEEESE